ncbi:thioesterase superfamily protein [Herbihabitans rhizosphaerae]|uniref:Thioesterase superfamily protein n=1 Tax=Herbihabitans rhizosphaerae TaxID=1872711 RepID=A0A4Q7L5D5_9PSEU|nr:thioesterase family protein [Herbihabitans rhizosphaerae]RZS43452.1 thioesterase superfamily protein [Herbihabitans rhizosphaerae]
MTAFFQPLGENRYAASELTAAVWSPDHQHVGPPSALLARELERLPSTVDTAGGGTFGRITFEVLGRVPVAEVEVSARVERPGRAVELLVAELVAEGRVALRANAWRIARADTTAVVAGLPEPLPGPDEAKQMPMPDNWHSGYAKAMEWRSIHSGMFIPGDATVWVRPLVDLVEGETLTDLQRLLTVADSASGVSSRLDPREWLFINTDLTVHLYRMPAGEWTALDATTILGPDGVGMATSTLHDVHGPLGRTTQALLVRPQR